MCFSTERLPVRPIISPEYPKNATVFLGENVTFECPVLSDLQPHIEWYKLCTINGSYEFPDGETCLQKVCIKSINLQLFPLPTSHVHRMQICSLSPCFE